MKRNKLFSLIIAASIVFGAITPLSDSLVSAQSKAAAVFKDVSSSHWAATAINWGYTEGIVTGDDKGYFHPSNHVSEPEFLAMLVRAYSDDLKIRSKTSNEKWYIPYFDLATDQFMKVNGSNFVYQRYHVANLVYSLLKGSYQTDEKSIQFLLDSSLSSGKTSATISGYLPYDHLSRAEAIVFIQRMKQLYPSVKDTMNASVQYSNGLRDISIGDTEASLIKALGNPDRKDVSENSFTWYVYNKNVNQFAMYGVSSDKKVVALYSNARNVWGKSNKVLVGHSESQLEKVIGSKVDLHVFGYYQVKQNDITTNYYIDSLNENSVDAILQYNSSVSGSSLATQDQIDAAFEKQIVDITNVFRNKNSVNGTLAWNDKVAKVAYAHSKDMSVNNYLNHINLKGQDPKARLKAAGFSNFANGENIAYGYDNAFSVMTGWVNSKGHRENMLLPNYKEIGVGVYRTYYTQNFILQH